MLQTYPPRNAPHQVSVNAEQRLVTDVNFGSVEGRRRGRQYVPPQGSMLLPEKSPALLADHTGEPAGESPMSTPPPVEPVTTADPQPGGESLSLSLW